MSEKHQGQCFCGAVRYRLRSRPIFVNCCHCRDCQRQTGSAFALNGMIETDRIEIVQGTPAMVTVSTGSGRPHDIYRCAECQTALWSDYGRRGWLSFVRVTTLDEADAFPPDAHIFTRSKLPWVKLEGAPAFEEYYDPQSLWSVESMERWKKASAAAG